MNLSLVLFLFLSSQCLHSNEFDQCRLRDTCLQSSSISPSIFDEDYIQSRNCFCDELCHQYSDCCDDQPKHRNGYRCVDYLSPTINTQIQSIRSLPIWMWTKCLANYIDSPLDIQCRNLNEETFLENPLLYLPVTSLQTNITYRNAYCALCNNQRKSELRFWKYEIYCQGNQTNLDYQVLNDDQQAQNCEKIIRYPDIPGTVQPSLLLRPCKVTLPAVCPRGTPTDLARNCSTSAAAYRYDRVTNLIYHNPYCAKCHQIETDRITCEDPIQTSPILLSSPSGAQPLSILFNPNLLQRYLNSDIHKDSPQRRIYSLARYCKKSDQIYNLFLRKCSNITEKRILSMKCLYPVQTFEDYHLYPNESLILIDRSLLLNKDQYVFLNNQQILFCTDQWKRQLFLRFSSYRYILSIICTSISLLCLLVFIIFYWLIPSLQNLPGQCLFILSISLFFGQLIFLTTSDRIDLPVLCFISAILIHYFYLSSFVWLLVIAIQIHSTFQREIIQPDQNNSNRLEFIVYNVLVCCSTNLLILIGCFIQSTDPQSSFSPNYGFLFCSISKSNALVLFFLLPIGILLFIVAVLFFNTIRMIYRSHQMAKLATDSSTNNSADHRLILIYIRLASLMGLQWLILIGALIVRQKWLWVIFEVINSLPGVFICLGFLCSPKLWKNVKEHLSMKLDIRRQSPKINTISTSLMTPTSHRSS